MARAEHVLELCVAEAKAKPRNKPSTLEEEAVHNNNSHPEKSPQEQNQEWMNASQAHYLLQRGWLINQSPYQCYT